MRCPARTRSTMRSTMVDGDLVSYPPSGGPLRPGEISLVKPYPASRREPDPSGVSIEQLETRLLLFAKIVLDIVAEVGGAERLPLGRLLEILASHCSGIQDPVVARLLQFPDMRTG